MKKVSFFIVFALLVCSAYGQTRTITSNGNWETSGNWSGGNIATVITDDVVMNNSTDITVNSNPSVGNFTTGNSCALTISSGFTLTIGAPGTPKLFTIPNGLNLTVIGSLVINGDLDVSNNINVTVTGTFTVTGNIIVNNNSSFSVIGGNINVGGSFTGGNNTAISLTSPGGMSVGGNLFVDNGSTLSGNGILHVGGTCTGPICSDSQLPVELLFFNGLARESEIVFNWATASELNFDHFEIEKSVDGINFFALHSIGGHGTSSMRHNYQSSDHNPWVGRNYYRLKSIDLDGYSEYFHTIVVNFFASKNFNIFPNPGEGHEVKIDLNFSPSEKAMVSIFDSYGKLISTYSLTERQVAITNSEPLKPGLYLATISSGDFSKSVRFVVK